MKSKVKQILCSIFLLGSLLWYSSCNQTKPQDTEPIEQPQPTHNLNEIYSHVRENKLPPLDTSELSVIPPPGERTPIERLSRAPQDLVGTTVNLSVVFSDCDKTMALNEEIVYCFSKQNDDKTMLFILYSLGTPIMLSLETPYENAEELLAESRVWSGVVTSINIITYDDYIYPQMEVKHMETHGEAQSYDGPICYGRIFHNEDSKEAERLCYSCDSMDDIKPFKITFERFGVLE